MKTFLITAVITNGDRQHYTYAQHEAKNETEAFDWAKKECDEGGIFFYDDLCIEAEIYSAQEITKEQSKTLHDLTVASIF